MNGLTLLLLIGLIILAMRKKEAPQYPSLLRLIEVKHVAVDWLELWVYGIDSDRNEEMILWIILSPNWHVGEWASPPAQHISDTPIIKIRVESARATKPGNQVRLNFEDRDSIIVMLDSGESTRTVDVGKAQ